CAGGGLILSDARLLLGTGVRPGGGALHAAGFPGVNGAAVGRSPWEAARKPRGRRRPALLAKPEKLGIRSQSIERQGHGVASTSCTWASARAPPTSSGGGSSVTRTSICVSDTISAKDLCPNLLAAASTIVRGAGPITARHTP